MPRVKQRNPKALRDQIEEAKKAQQRKATRRKKSASGTEGACRRKGRGTSATHKSSESAGRCKVQSLSNPVTSHETSSTTKQTQSAVTHIKQVNGKLRMEQNLDSGLNSMIQGSFTEYGALLNGRRKNTLHKTCKEKCDPLETKNNRNTAFEVLLRVMEPELSGLDGGSFDCNRWRQQQQQWMHQHLGSDNDSTPASPRNSSPTASVRQENQESTGKASKCVCHICQRVCNKPSVLEKHVRSHTGERPYPCSVCDFSFKTKSNLYKHMRSQMHKVRSLMTKECEDVDDCTVHKHHYSDDDSDEILEDDLEPEMPLHSDSTQLHRDRVNSPIVSHCMETELPSQNKLETVTMASAVFSASGKSSVDSGYLSHSESTEQVTAATYSPSHKSVEDGVGIKPAVPLVTLLVPVCLSTAEKNVTAPTPIHNTIGAHIDKLISLNEAVVDSRGLESVKPRRMSASRRASIDSPRPYTIQNSFQFDLPRPVSTTSVGWQVGSSLPSPDKLKSLKSQPPLLPKTTDFDKSNLQLIKPSQIDLGQSTTELQSQPLDEVNSLCSDGVFSGPDGRNLQPRPLVRQKAVGSGEGQTDLSLRGRNKACRRRLMLECETCGVRYRKRDNYEAHKRYYCSEFSAPRQQQTKRPSDAGTPPQLGHYRVSACATLEQAPLIKRKKQNRRAVAGRSVLAETRSNPQLTISSNFCSSLPISAGNDRGQGTSARPCGMFETAQVSACHLSPLVVSDIGKGTSLLANAQLLTPDPSPPAPEHSARQWARVMNDSRPAISRQDVCSFSVARTPIAAVAPLSPFLDSEGVRATTRLPISNPKNGLLGFSSYPPTARMLKTESLEQVHLGKTPNEAVFERSHSLETSPSSRRLSATKANSVDFLLGKTSAQQSGGKISVIQHTNSLSRGGSLEAIDTVHVQKADLEKGGPPAHNQESSQENDVGCSIYSKETTAESGVCCQDGDNSNVDEKCRTELTPKGKFLGMAEFQRGIKENDVSDAKTRLFVPAKVDMSAQTALSKSPPQTCVRDASLTVTEQHAVITSQTSSKETVSQTSSSHISKRNSPHKRQLLRQLSVSDEFELHDSASLRTMTDGTLPSKNVATTASNVQSRDVWMSDSQNQQASMRCSTSWSTVAISSAVTIPLPFENPLFMPKYMIQLHNGSGIQVPDACSSSSMPAVTLPTSLPPQNDATNSNAVSAPINLTMSYHSQHGDQKIGLEESIPSVSTAAFSILQMAAAATPNAPLPGIQSSIRDLSSSNFTGDHNINPALYPITDPVSEAFPDHTDTKYPPGSSPTKTTSSDVFVPLKPQSVTFHELTNQPQPLCTVFQTPQTLPLTGEKDCLPTLQNFGQTQTPSGTLGGNEVSFSSSSSSIFSSSSSTSSLTSSSLNCTAALTSNSTPASCTNSSSSVYSYKTSTSNSPTLVSAAKKRRLSYKKYGKKAEKHVIEKRTPKLSTRGKKVNVTEVTEKIESTEIIENDEARPVTMAPKLAQGAETTRQHEGNENDSGPASSSSVSTPSRATEIADGNSTHKETLLFDGEETCGENVSLPKCKLVQQCELETTQLSAGSGAAPETSCQSGARPTGHRALSSRGCRRPQTCETQARKPCEEMKIKIEESNEGSGMDEMNEPSLLDEDEENALQTDTELVDEDIDQHFKKSVTTLQDIEGGYMSTEQYVYVRGRGRGRFVCQECGIRCHKPSMLRKHIRSHTDLRPYQCIPCSFSFKTKGNLTKHERSRAHYKQCLMKAGVDADAQEQDQSSDNESQKGCSASTDLPATIQIVKADLMDVSRTGDSGSIPAMQ